MRRMLSRVPTSSVLTCQVFLNVLAEDKEFGGLFFQNKNMKSNFDAYPEILLLDVTYKLLHFSGIIYLFIVKDSISSSELISVGILVGGN